LQTAPVSFPHVSIQAHELPAVVIREPGRAPLCLVVRGPAIEVGRDCRGVLLTDPQISRRHLALHEASGVVYVTDLGSTTGTRVDGDPIAGARLLAPGQVVQLGATTIVLLRDPPDQAQAGDAVGVPTVRGDRASEAEATYSEAQAGDAVGVPTGRGDRASEAEAAYRQGLTIVVSDVDDASHRGLDLGATNRLSLLEMHNSIVRRQVARHRGTEVRATGDGFMLSFPTASNALSCMVDVQRALYALARSRPADGVRVRVGVHSGDVIVADDGDLSGPHIVIAAHVAAAARGGEILVSARVRELVEPSPEFRFGPPRVVRPLGLGQELLLHPVAWEDANMRSST
jgi:class 3 adenylate cyclase